MPSTSSIEAGRAVVRVFADDSLLPRTLGKARRRLESFSARTANIGATLFGAGAVASAPFASTIESASRLEETMNKFNTVFGENSAEVKQWGDGFAGQVGRSQEQIASFMAGSQDLFVPLGFDESAATAMSKQLTALSIDLASFNNMADADTLRDLQAALTGSGEVMKKYGVIVSEAAVKQELLNSSIDPKTATDQQKVQARLSIIMRGTTAAQGDAIRSSGSYANQMKRLKGSADDLSASIGGAVLPAVTKAVTIFGTGVRSLKDWATENQGLIVAAAAVAGGTTLAGAGILGLAAAAKVGALGMGLLATGVKGVGIAVALVTSPVSLITAAVTGLGVVAAKQFGLTEIAAQKLGTAWGVLKTDALTAWSGISAALQSGDISAAMSVAGALLELEWGRITSGLTSTWDDWMNAFSGVLDKAAARWVEFVNGMREVWAHSQGYLTVEIARAIGGDDAADEAKAMVNPGIQDLMRLNAKGESDIGREHRAAADRRRAEASERAAKAQERLAEAEQKLKDAAEKARKAATATTKAPTVPGAASPTGTAGAGSSRVSTSTFAGLAGTSQVGVASRLAYSAVVGRVGTQDPKNPVPHIEKTNELLETLNNSVLETMPVYA